MSIFKFSVGFVDNKGAIIFFHIIDIVYIHEPLVCTQQYPSKVIVQLLARTQSDDLIHMMSG